MAGDGVVFVAWQHPERRGIYPVGRLMERSGTPRFEFTYIASVGEAKTAGFSPFLAFPELDSVYRSDQLFPLFQNRLMPANRPDYPEYLRRLDLPADVGPVTLLLRSGGGRATDRVELFGRPTFDQARMVYSYEFFVRAVRHIPHAEETAQSLQPGERLRCTSDWQNPSDLNAILLRTEPPALIGFLPQYIAEDLGPHASARQSLEVHVVRVNPEPAPPQHRVFCRLDAPARDGFVPFASQRYKPRAADAWALPPLANAIVT